MSNYRRARFPGGLYFFTVITHRRRPVLTDPRMRAALRDAITQTRAGLPFEIVAWVLLPDHLHAIWRLPEGDADTGKRWSLIKSQVTRANEAWSSHEPASPSRTKRGEGTLWQRRFWEHLLLDDADLEKHVDYIHYNPVKHGHVARVAD